MVASKRASYEGAMVTVAVVAVATADLAAAVVATETSMSRQRWQQWWQG